MTAQASLHLPEGSAAPAPSFTAPEPQSAADAAAIADFAADETLSRLRDFMAIHDTLPLDVLARAIRIACLRGFGTWMVPDEHTHRPHHRPGTHLVEIAFLGALGCGPSLIEATNSWRLAARHLLDQSPTD